MNKNKIQVLVYLYPETRTKIDRYIAKFYESPYGALSHLVEQAVLNYIEPDEGDSTQMHKNPVTVSRVDKHCQEIVQYLKSQGYLFQFHRSTLYEAIGFVRGTDDRTLKKWHKNLIQYGWIVDKHGTGTIFEFGPKGHTLSEGKPE